MEALTARLFMVRIFTLFLLRSLSGHAFFTLVRHFARTGIQGSVFPCTRRVSGALAVLVQPVAQFVSLLKNFFVLG